MRELIKKSLILILIPTFILTGCTVSEVAQGQRTLERFRNRIWRAPKGSISGDFTGDNHRIEGFSNTKFVETNPQDHFIDQPIVVEKVGISKENFKSLKTPFDSEITSVFESEERAFFATYKGSIYQLENNNKVQLQKIGSIKGEVFSLAYDTKLDLLAVAGYGSIQVIELKSKKLVGNMTRISGRISSLSWDPKGEFLAFGLADGSVGLWDWNYGPKSGEDDLNSLDYYPNQGSPVEKVLFHPNGGIFFIGMRNGVINALRLKRTEEELGLYDENALSDRGQKGASVSNLTTMQGAVLNLKILDKRLVALSSTGELYSWNIRGFDKIDEFKVAGDSVSDFTNINENNFVVVGRSKKVTTVCKNKTSAQSLPLEATPVKIGRFSSSELLWIVQKTGILTFLNTQGLNCNKS